MTERETPPHGIRGDRVGSRCAQCWLAVTATALNDMGFRYQNAECDDGALIYHQKAQVIGEEIGDLSQQAMARRGIAGVCRGCGHYGEAFGRYQAALTLARQIGDPYQEAKILEGLAETALSTRRPDAARILLRQALDLFERLGVPEAEAARIRIEALNLAHPAPPGPAPQPAAGGWVPLGTHRPAIRPASKHPPDPAGAAPT